MKRIYVILAGILACAASAATVADAQQGVPSAHASRGAVVALRHTSLGKVLVSSSGRTLYEFTRDHANKDTCAAISGCSATWPPLLSSGRPSAGPGVQGSMLAGGKSQVTYGGHPLYLYSEDAGPGETSYVGVKAFGGSWDAVSSSGRTVK